MQPAPEGMQSVPVLLVYWGGGGPSFWSVIVAFIGKTGERRLLNSELSTGSCRHGQRLGPEKKKSRVPCKKEEREKKKGKRVSNPCRRDLFVVGVLCFLRSFSFGERRKGGGVARQYVETRLREKKKKVAERYRHHELRSRCSVTWRRVSAVPGQALLVCSRHC
jgi:hypothetical protein